ncbi:hypothetical protein F5050DRAFT_1716398 [Lentinula boryana]|uniref:WD40 repeat-like protein n=1 Tax=Lentinula boryana TaxID=40481 RepID=A0ABQ8PXA6_9AGAR|nr:hypothetical protein F5050DRAFT_1716398 [Lentinula boryana]
MNNSNEPKTYSSTRGKYALQGLLVGQKGAVTCIAVHPLGIFAACGGMRIWHLPTGKSLLTPTNTADRGITTAIVWLTKPDDDNDGLAYGTEHGSFASGSGTRMNTHSGQLAVVHRAEAVHRFVIDGGMSPRTISSITIRDHWPQAVAFGQVGVRGPELWTFGREDGVIYILNDEGKILKAKTTGAVIGHAVLSAKDDAIILDNVSQGIALYKLSGTERIRTFQVPHNERRSRNVAFHDGTSTIVIGSDHGRVYEFDRRTGQISDIIDIRVRERVQSIAVWVKVATPLNRPASRKTFEDGQHTDPKTSA